MPSEKIKFPKLIFSTTNLKPNTSSLSNLDDLNSFNYIKTKIEKQKVFKIIKIKKINNWTEEEDFRLFDLVRNSGLKRWKKIAEFFSGKSSIQCSSRYKRILPGLSKGYWTKKEDEKLMEGFIKHGKNWKLIAKDMKNRSGKQIRDRFLNSLNPELNKDKFTQEEDNELVKLFNLHGPAWSKISYNLKGRSGDMVKNRFFSILRAKKIPICQIKFHQRLLLNSVKSKSIIGRSFSKKKNSLKKKNYIFGPIIKKTRKNDVRYQEKIDPKDNNLENNLLKCLKDSKNKIVDDNFNKNTNEKNKFSYKENEIDYSLSKEINSEFLDKCQLPASISTDLDKYDSPVLRSFENKDFSDINNFDIKINLKNKIIKINNKYYTLQENKVCGDYIFQEKNFVRKYPENILDKIFLNKKRKRTMIKNAENNYLKSDIRENNPFYGKKIILDCKNGYKSKNDDSILGDKIKDDHENIIQNLSKNNKSSLKFMNETNDKNKENSTEFIKIINYALNLNFNSFKNENFLNIIQNNLSDSMNIFIYKFIEDLYINTNLNCKIMFKNIVYHVIDFHNKFEDSLILLWNQFISDVKDFEILLYMINNSICFR